MQAIFPALLPLLIVLIGLAVIVGFPLGGMLKGLGRIGLILLLVGVAASLAPAILDYLQKNPPRSVQELGIWLGCAFGLFLIVHRIIFGPGAVKRLFERLVTSAVYDVLKSLTRTLFFGYRSLVVALLKLIR